MTFSLALILILMSLKVCQSILDMEVLKVMSKTYYPQLKLLIFINPDLRPFKRLIMSPQEFDIYVIGTPEPSGTPLGNELYIWSDPPGDFCKSIIQFTSIPFLVNVKSKGRIDIDIKTCDVRIDHILYVYYTEGNNLCVEEVYHVNGVMVRHLLMVFDLKTKRSVSAGQTMDFSIHSRRSNFMGSKFKALVAKYKPYITSIKDVKGKTIPEGYLVDIMAVMAKRLNFTLDYMPANGKTGTSWSSIVKYIGSNDQDVWMAVSGFTQTKSRMEHVEFSVPVSRSRLFLAYIRDDQGTDWKALFFRPLTMESWMAILVQIIGSICLLVIRDGLLCNHWRQSIISIIAGSMAVVLKSSVSRMIPLDRTNGSFSGRVLLLTISWGGFVIFSLYKCMLGASLAIRIEKEPVDSLEQIMDGSDFKVICSPGTSTEAYLRGKFRQDQVDSHLEPLPSGLSLIQILDLMANGTYSSSHLLLKSIPLDNKFYYERDPCKIGTLRRSYRSREVGMIFKPNWPFLKIFNYQFLRVSEQGFTQRSFFHHRPMEVDPSLCNERRIGTSLTDLLLLPIILGSGFVFAVLILSVEKFISISKMR